MFETIEKEKINSFKNNLSKCVNVTRKAFTNKQLIISNFSRKNLIGFITYGKASIIKTDINGNYEYYLTTHRTGVLSIGYGVDKVEIATITQNNVGSNVLFQSGDYDYNSYFIFRNADILLLVVMEHII